MVSAQLYLGLVLLVAAERGLELALSRRNLALALARGGRLVGGRHTAVMALMHTAFLLACPLEVWALGRPLIPALAIGCGLVLLATMALRYWVIASLGWRWNIAVVVVPGLAPISSGPYRWLRHPNYLAVVAELLALPLLHGAWLSALVFGLANALLLRVRIGVEEAALRQAGGYAPLEGRPRLLPGSWG